jgi:hypothetical protein
MEPCPVPLGMRRRRSSARPRMEHGEVREVEGADDQRHTEKHSKNLPCNDSQIHRSSAERYDHAFSGGAQAPSAATRGYAVLPPVEPSRKGLPNTRTNLSKLVARSAGS